MNDPNREAFEDNAMSEEFDVAMHDGEYNGDTQRAWTIWQAACEHTECEIARQRLCKCARCNCTGY